MSAMAVLIAKLKADLSSLHNLLKRVLKEGELLDHDVLVKQGVIVRRYSIRKEKLREGGEVLQRLNDELSRAVGLEHEMLYNRDEVLQELGALEKNYFAKYERRIDLTEQFTRHMANAFEMTRRAHARVGQIQDALRDDQGRDVEYLISSLEKMVNQVVKFLDLLQFTVDQIPDVKIERYDTARTYGRAMSREEARETKKGKMLIGSRNHEEGRYVSAFDCPEAVERRIVSMSCDQRKIFFEQVGVHSPDAVLIFETRVVPVVGPVPQSNGLREFKFLRGTEIEVLRAA